MYESEFLQGNNARWRFLQMLGEGDAGEVFLVESLWDRKRAILKRPRKSSFSADILRQSNQIGTEASLLNTLANIQVASGSFIVTPPLLVDQSIPGNELTDRYFMIIEQAPGFDLGVLEKIVQLGYEEPPQIKDKAYPPEIFHFLRQICSARQLPPLLLTRAIWGLLSFLQAAHQQEVHWIDGDHTGILWNDVKLDHLFWDPGSCRLTIIDWGNGQVLEQDGATKDRLHSAIDDNRQFVEVIGHFLASSAPDLYDQLEWGQLDRSGTNTEGQFQALKEHLEDLIQRQAQEIPANRQAEGELLAMEKPGPALLADLDSLQMKIVLTGEMPDYSGAAHFYERMAARMAQEKRWAQFDRLCERTLTYPNSNIKNWQLLALLNRNAEGEDGLSADYFCEALQAGLQEDWANCLWNLCLATQKDLTPQRWRNLSTAVRSMVSEIQPDAPTPLAAASALQQSLEQNLPQLREFLEHARHAESFAEEGTAEAQLKYLEDLVFRYKMDVINKWSDDDPLPPGADLTYTSVEAILNALSEVFAQIGLEPGEAFTSLSAALNQPKALINIVMDAWQARGFKTARQGLRTLLLWDPDRRRVLQADRVVQNASEWLNEMTDGPQKNEKIQDFSLRMEFYYREMRSRVGSAPWVDNALELLSELRSGKRPGDLVTSKPRWPDAYPWLNRYGKKLSVNGLIKQSTHTQREKPGILLVNDRRESRFGAQEDFTLAEPLDTWTPEAPGSSARVFLGFVRDTGHRIRQSAVKIMRPGKADYALPLFREEVQILSVLKHIPGVIQMLEFGYLLPDNGQSLPSETGGDGAHSLSGNIIRFPLSQSEAYLAEMVDRVEQAWLPYLVLEKIDQDECLLTLCDAGHTRGHFFPVETGLQAIVKACDILEVAHLHNIAYRDHKILHYYWNPRLKRVFILDWNVAKLYPQGIGDHDIQMDLVQFGARTLHHILTGRPAPGALPVGANRPDEIDTAPQMYTPAWTYDDNLRLSLEVKEILARSLAGQYDQVAQLREDILLRFPSLTP